MHKYRLQTIDVNDSKAVVVKIYKNNNDFINIGEVVCTVETTKVALDIESEKSGYIEYKVEEGERVAYGQILFIIKEIKNEKNDEVEFSPDPQIMETDNTITQKAHDYIIKNNIDIYEVKKMFSNKSIITLQDVKGFNQNGNNTDEIINRIVVNNRKRIVILGAGNAAEVITDILLDYREYEVIGFVDDNPPSSYNFYGISVIYNDIQGFAFEYDRSLYDAVIISFGGKDLNNKKKIYEIYRKQNIDFVNAIDRTAKIGRNVSIGSGNVIGAFSYIGTSSVIGNNNWIAASANIDHHNVLGSHNLIGPNVSSPGEVKIANMNKIGANSSLSNHVTVGSNNIIMNNKCIVRNIGDNTIIK